MSRVHSLPVQLNGAFTGCFHASFCLNDPPPTSAALKVVFMVVDLICVWSWSILLNPSPSTLGPPLLTVRPPISPLSTSAIRFRWPGMLIKPSARGWRVVIISRAATALVLRRKPSLPSMTTKTSVFWPRSTMGNTRLIPLLIQVGFTIWNRPSLILRWLPVI